MKRSAISILVASLATVHSCVSLDLGYSGTDEAGKSFHIGIRSEIPWPAQKAAPAPVWESGKAPVPVAP